MRRVLNALALITAVAALQAPSGATPTGYPPGITAAVSPSSAEAGTPRTVSGSGCVPDGTSVTIAVGGAVVASTTSSGGAGTYSAGGLFADLAAGTYGVTVTCGEESATTSFEVTGSGTTSTSTPAGTNQITVSDTTVTGGQVIDVTACCFEPGTDVDLIFQSDPVLLATATAGAGGAIATQVAIPVGAALGAHTLTATGTGLDGSPLALAVGLTVLEASSTATTPAPTPGSGGVTTQTVDTLPRTGSSTSSLVWLAGGLVVMGSATTVAARRRLATRA